MAAFGQSTADSFIRFYSIPSYGHGFGPRNLSYDGLDVLRNWVEGGVAPKTTASVDSNKGANRGRPMCRWPARPIFTSVAGASRGATVNFTCRKP